MPSNTTLNTGSGGDVITSKQRSHDGDTTKQQGVFISGVTGTEDAYTFTDVQAGGGTEANALRVTIANDSTGVVTVDGTGTFTVDGSGVTQPVSGTVTANAGTGTMSVDLGANNDVTVTGGNAHDGTTLGNPVLGGARATNSVEGITQVANADLTHVQADLNGVTLTRPHTTLEEIVAERDSITTGTSTAFATAFAAPGAGNHLYVTAISVANTSANDTYIDFQDGAAGAVIWTMALPANGGANMTFPTPLKVADNTALAYQVGTASTTVYISVCGFTAKG